MRPEVLLRMVVLVVTVGPHPLALWSHSQALPVDRADFTIVRGPGAQARAAITGISLVAQGCYRATRTERLARAAPHHSSRAEVRVDLDQAGEVDLAEAVRPAFSQAGTVVTAGI